MQPKKNFDFELISKSAEIKQADKLAQVCKKLGLNPAAIEKD